MLRIKRSANGQVVFTLSGQINEEQIGELEALIQSEAKGSEIVLDLRTR
jgi:anti-anti-sigma regulatory factor